MARNDTLKMIHLRRPIKFSLISIIDWKGVATGKKALIYIIGKYFTQGTIAPKVIIPTVVFVSQKDI